MSRAGALSSIGSSPGRLAVLRSPVASAHCAAVCASWLSCSRLVLLAFSCSLPPPALVQKNETHPATTLSLTVLAFSDTLVPTHRRGELIGPTPGEPVTRTCSLGR